MNSGSVFKTVLPAIAFVVLLAGCDAGGSPLVINEGDVVSTYNVTMM